MIYKIPRQYTDCETGPSPLGSTPVAKRQLGESVGGESHTQGCCYWIQDISHVINEGEICHVHWDMDEFHKIADEAHDSEANGNCPADMQVFWNQKHIRNDSCLYPRTSNLFAWVLCTVSRTADRGR